MCYVAISTMYNIGNRPTEHFCEDRVLNPQDVVDFHVKWKESIYTAMIQYTKHLIKG